MLSDSKSLTGSQSPGRIQNATDSAMKRWNTAIGKVRKGLANRRATSYKAADIKDSTSSGEVQQDTNPEVRQQIGSEIQLDAEPIVQQESSKSDRPTKHSHPTQRSDELTACWFAMRSPLPGHIHNILCPFWRVGDCETPKTECPKDKTFTLFDGNPFTRAGAQHQTLLVERDRLAKERENAKAENAELVEEHTAAII